MAKTPTAKPQRKQPAARRGNDTKKTTTTRAKAKKVEPEPESDSASESEEEKPAGKTRRLKEQSFIQDLATEYNKKSMSSNADTSAAFHLQRKAVYDSDRKARLEAVQNGRKALEATRQRLHEYGKRQTDNGGFSGALDNLAAQQEAMYTGVLSAYTATIEDIAVSSAKAVDETCHSAMAYADERKKYLLQLKLAAETNLFDAMEQEKIASDASALIKSVKILERS